ncbi:U-box domain-containing protein 4 [Acorus gramineus]|uniref:U-box domain-containing protein 4 n=1 Tax=Acorus gramineus TaxID=55184 RepID=A0AAV9BCW6_ACOGR|nr:U-box domain-containing protein 4 [Acorus gramineus]
MVSLADSPSPTRSPSTPSKIHRSLGRSMRTVRSTLLDRPPSEALSDSFIDFTLHQLSLLPPPPSPFHHHPFFDADDASGTSFGSDISGELQRLASISPIPHRDLPPSDSAAEEVTVASLAELGPAIAACVDGLASDSLESKRSAAARLRLLAKHRSDFRAAIGADPGAIPSLVPLLRSGDPSTQENAVTALLNLSLEEPNKTLITSAGAIKPLIYALKTGTSVSKQNAACALMSLSLIEDNRGTIGACGAVPPLVSLLQNGSDRGKKDALTTLYKLCSVRRNKERAVEAGAVAPLVELAGGGAGVAWRRKRCLAGIPEGRTGIVEEGGIPVLVEVIEDGSGRGKEFAVSAMLQLCGDPRNRSLMVREGAIPPLVALSQTGSARAKHKMEEDGSQVAKQSVVGYDFGWGNCVIHFFIPGPKLFLDICVSNDKIHLHQTLKNVCGSSGNGS